MAAGRIEGPYQLIEIICLVNKLFASMWFDRMLEELEPLGKADEYATAERIGDSERSARLMTEMIGKKGLMKIGPQLVRRLRDDLGIPEMEPQAARGRWSTNGKKRSEHSLSWLAAEDAGDPAVLTTDEGNFERFFVLDGPGYWIAKDAFVQGVIGTPYEMVDTICAAHKSCATKIVKRLEAALAKHGRASEMWAAPGSEAILDLAVSTLGDSVVGKILSGSVRDAAEEFHVSVTETKSTRNEKFELWIAGSDETPS
jgi:hypothetical protein